MLVLFCAPLTVLAVCETLLRTKSSYIQNWFGEDSGFGDENTPEVQNPEVDHEDGLKISKVDFKDLIKQFPNTLHVCCNPIIASLFLNQLSTKSSDQTILHEIHALKRRIDELAAKMTNANEA